MIRISVSIFLACLALAASSCGSKPAGRPVVPVIGAADLSAVFGTHTKSLLVDPVPDGHQMDIALANCRWYLLVMQESSTNDPLLRRHPSIGAIEQTWQYPIKYAAGLTTDRTNLRVMNRSATPFLRRLDKTAPSCAPPPYALSRPEGDPVLNPEASQAAAD